MLKINLSKPSTKALLSIHPKHGKQIALKIKDLASREGSVQDSKKLKGYPYKRVDAGEYRIVYEIQKQTLSIFLVGKRNDDEIYRKLSRKTN